MNDLVRMTEECKVPLEDWLLETDRGFKVLIRSVLHQTFNQSNI